MTSSTSTARSTDLGELAGIASRISRSIAKVIEGKPEAIDTALTVLLAEGHLLIEDVPGVGKTMLAKALASTIDAKVRRIQFTPDLLPSDITGVSVFNRHTHDFEFKPGAIFANIVVGDEINRASPKTQSALLESMGERQVTVDSRTYDLGRPFMVIATQNPIEMEGTYPLPEAQRDRFMARISMGYPGHNSEVAMLGTHGATDPLDSLRPVCDTDTINRLTAQVRHTYVAESIRDYVVSVVESTRDSQQLRLGASPRASLQLMRAAQAAALLDGREFVLPDDVQRLAAPVLAHRVMPAGEAHLSGSSAANIVTRLVDQVPVPRQSRS